MLTVATTALTPAAQAASYINLNSGAGYGLGGISYENAISDNTSFEVGVGSVLLAATVVVGGKYFLNTTNQGGYFAGRGAAVFFPGAIGGMGIATGGYRWALDQFHIDLEGGLGYLNVTDGYSVGSAFTPALGLSAGYRF